MCDYGPVIGRIAFTDLESDRIFAAAREFHGRLIKLSDLPNGSNLRLHGDRRQEAEEQTETFTPGHRPAGCPGWFQFKSTDGKPSDGLPLSSLDCNSRCSFILAHDKGKCMSQIMISSISNLAALTIYFFILGHDKV